MEIEERLRWWVLHKMIWHTWVGKRHISIDNIPKGQAKHLHKIIKKIIKELRKEGLVIFKPAHYGIEVSLNPRRIEEIIKYVEENEPKFGRKR